MSTLVSTEASNSLARESGRESDRASVVGTGSLGCSPVWKLTIEDDEGYRTVVPLVGERITIGRADGHTVRLTERNVSRNHAAILRLGEGFFIEDSGSSNGVFVNRQRLVGRHELQAGDVVQIGDYRMESHNEAAPSRPLPPPTPPPAYPVYMSTAAPAPLPAQIARAASFGSAPPLVHSAPGGGVGVKTKPSTAAWGMAIGGGIALAGVAWLVTSRTGTSEPPLASAPSTHRDTEERLARAARLHETADTPAAHVDPNGAAADELLVVAPTPLAPTVSPTPPVARPSNATASRPAAVTARSPAAASPTPLLAPTCAAWQADYGAAMRAKEYECVRTILAPRLNTGSISPGEAKYLKAACAALGDGTCQKRAAEKI